MRIAQPSSFARHGCPGTAREGRPSGGDPGNTAGDQTALPARDDKQADKKEDDHDPGLYPIPPRRIGNLQGEQQQQYSQDKGKRQALRIGIVRAYHASKIYPLPTHRPWRAAKDHFS
jgi:hypothetical protein